MVVMRYIIFCILVILSFFIFPAQAKVNANKGIVFCSESNITNMNPQRYQISTMASSLSYAIYDRLLEMNPINKAVTDGIGSFEYVTNNDKTYVYRINKNIHFHHNKYFTPSRTLNAEDVAFSFDRMLNPKNPFYKPKDYFPYYGSLDISSNIESVVALSDDLVEFNLKKPSSLLIPFLATDNSVILSKEYADTILEKGLPLETIDYYAIGTGPFYQQRFIRDRYVRMLPFNEYHGKKASITPLVFTHSSHVNKRLYQLYTNECQIISNPTSSQEAFLQSRDTPFNIVQRSSLIGTFLIFNTKNPDLAITNNRRFISSLIDLKTLNETVYFGQGYYISDLMQNYKYEISIADLDYHKMVLKNKNKNKMIFSSDTAYQISSAQNKQEESSIFSSSLDFLKENYGSMKTAPQYTVDPNITDKSHNHIQRVKEIPFTHEQAQEAKERLQNKYLDIAIFERNTIGINTHMKIAQFIKSALEKQGIKVVIRYYSLNDYNKLKNGKFDIALVNIFSDYTNLVEPLVSCNTSYKSLGYMPKNSQLNYFHNFTGWCNDKLDDYYRDLTILTDYADTRILKKNINTILNNEMPIVPLIYTLNKFVAVDNIQNIRQTAYGGISFIHASIDEGDEE